MTDTTDPKAKRKEIDRRFWEKNRERILAERKNAPAKTVVFKCLHCDKENTTLVKRSSKARQRYCSLQCFADHKSDAAIKSGTASTKSIKKFLVKTTNNKCSSCGINEWNGKAIVMDLEHIDGNSENNDMSNLCLLCPNCHSQTPTYKGRNKGNGRHSRRQRYAEGKSY